MIKYFCDICGKEVPEKDFLVDGDSDTPIYEIIFNDNIYGDNEKFDVCKECYEKIKNNLVNTKEVLTEQNENP